MSNGMAWRPATYGRKLAAITAVGALIRLALIARQPLGYDEDFSAVAIHQPLDRMLDIVAHDSAPPLFYLLGRGVVAAGDAAGLSTLGGLGGPVALRLVPTLAGIALIPLIAALARRVSGSSGDAAGLWAAAFTAFVPAAVALSGFARMYGLAAALTAAAALAMWRAVERPTLPRWAAYVAVAAAAVWTDYFCLLALAGILVAATALRPPRRVLATAASATALAIATLLPWLYIASAQLQHTGQGFWVQPLGPSMLGGTLSQLFIGPAVDRGIPFGQVLGALQVVAVVGGCVGLLAFVRAWKALSVETRRSALFCLLVASGVPILAVVSVWRPILDARYASVMWLPIFALVGVGLATLPRPSAAAVLVAVALPSLALGIVPNHMDTSALVPELDAKVGPNDLVAAPWDHYLILLDEADPPVRSRLHVLSPGDPPWYVGTSAYPPGAVIHSVPVEVALSGGRIFWIASPGVDPPDLPAGYRPTETRCVNLACLTEFGLIPDWSGAA